MWELVRAITVLVCVRGLFGLTNTWTASDIPSKCWNSITTSDSGQYVAVAACLGGNIYQSSDYGSSWTANSQAPSSGFNWFSITSDSSGQQLVAVSNNGGGSGAMYITYNYGVTWTQTSAPSSMAWSCVASSSTGQYVMATSNTGTGGTGAIYVSNNYGDSWIQASTSSLYYNSVAVSSDGQYAVVVVSNGGIYLSSNYGVSFSKSSAPTEDYYYVSSDSTGQYLVAVVDGGGIYYSLNYGSTWSLSNAPSSGESWHSVSSDSTGQYVAASQGCFGYCAGYIYLSSDYGQTWYQSAASENSYDTLVSSSSGQIIYAAVYDSVVYQGTVSVPTVTDDQIIINGNDDTDDTPSPSTNAMSAGAIAGIVIAAAVLMGCVIGLEMHNRKKQEEARTFSTAGAEMGRVTPDTAPTSPGGMEDMENPVVLNPMDNTPPTV